MYFLLVIDLGIFQILQYPDQDPYHISMVSFATGEGVVGDFLISLSDGKVTR